MPSNAQRYWNQVLYTPSESKQNPLKPEFYHPPKIEEVQAAESYKKIEFYLKREIEEYRNDLKQISYSSKKDRMIKMLIDELDK